MRTSEVLDKAADLIERDGHWNGGPIVVSGSHCVMTAARKICPDTENRLAAYGPLIAAIGGRIPPWNDATPAAEVIAMLRAVAATERARECRMIETDADHVYVTVYA